MDIRNKLNTLINTKKNQINNYIKAGKFNVQDSYDFQNYEEWYLNKSNNINNKKLSYNPKISIIVPAYNTPITFFEEMLNSVFEQIYTNWELCIADGSDNSSLSDHLSKYSKFSHKIKYKKINNEGISGNTNIALSLADGKYIALFDHDDLLTKDALYYFVESLQHIHHDCLYCDEDIVSEDGKHFMGPNFKPDWSPSLFESHNYITHLFMTKKSIVDEIKGFRTEYDGAQDYDFISRCISKSSSVFHIPRILYHWRAHMNSTAGNSNSKIYAYENGKKVVEDMLNQKGLLVNVDFATNVLGFYHSKYKFEYNPLVSVYLKNNNFDLYKDKSCLNDVLNYSNIEYVDDLAKAKGEYIFILNGSILPNGENAFVELLGSCMRDEVGAVAGKILYNNIIIQHAGIILDKYNFARFAFAGISANGHGYMSRPLITANYSAVSTDCFLIKKALFEKFGGFEEKYKTAVQDIDLCLKIINNNKYIVCNGFSVWNSNKYLYKNCFNDKNEVDSCMYEWKDFFINEDPFYNKNFNLNKDLFMI